MGLLQVKKGDFRFIPMALVMITILFPKVSFPHLAVFCIFMGFLRWQKHIGPGALLSRGQIKGHLPRSLQE